MFKDLQRGTRLAMLTICMERLSPLQSLPEMPFSMMTERRTDGRSLAVARESASENDFVRF